MRQDVERLAVNVQGDLSAAADDVTAPPVTEYRPALY